MSRTLHDALHSIVDIRLWRAMPRPAALAPGSLVVVDLANPVDNSDPRDLLPALNKVDVWLVLGKQAVDPGWLEIVRYPRVNVITSPAALVNELGVRGRGASSQRTAAFVLEKEPALLRLAVYVHAICTHPWRIRHPRDLAVVVGEGLRNVKERCHAEGFTRVEHFIVCVRAIALEQLRQHQGLTIAAARNAVGFEDPSNMRRHLGRALLRSPEAAHRIHHLVAV